MASLSRSGLASRIASSLGASVDLEARLRSVAEQAPSRVVFTTSFGLEDQVLTHVIASAGLPVELVTLDTGRLFPETVALWALTERIYGVRVRSVLPDAPSTEMLVARDGVEGFRASLAARQACCHVRKVAPLSRALAGASTWITGLRTAQSDERRGSPLAEWDETHAVLKINPIADWTREALSTFVSEHRVPINELHAKGFASIGCAPCTRAIMPGEPERAGRWWWEDDGKKECGLHPPRRGAVVPAAPLLSNTRLEARDVSEAA
jgi:phosphoadenosine phosphosulfate reductase